MDKNLTQNLVDNFIKIILGGGSFYLIAEKVLDQIKHLFNLKSIETAFNFFSFIYGVVPLLVIGGYFLLKAGRLLVWRSKLISNYWFGLAFVLMILVASFTMVADDRSIKMLNSFLLIYSIGILTISIVAVTNLKFTQLAALKNEALLFSTLILIITQCFIWTNEGRINAASSHGNLKPTELFAAYDYVDQWRLENAFVGKTTVSESEFPTKSVREKLHIGIDKKTTREELIGLVKNEWGAYINAHQFKMVVALTPILISCMLLLFVVQSLLRRQRDDQLKQLITGEEFVVVDSGEQTDEVKFLKFAVFSLIILILPLFHPISRITVDFDHPFVNAGAVFKPQTIATAPTSQDTATVDYDEIEKRIDKHVKPLTENIDFLEKKVDVIDDNLRLFASRIGSDNEPPFPEDQGPTKEGNASKELRYKKHKKLQPKMARPL